MKFIFMNGCAVDGCNKKSQKDRQMCKKHQEAYEAGEKMTAFYGKTVQKNGKIPVGSSDNGLSLNLIIMDECKHCNLVNV